MNITDTDIEEWTAYLRVSTWREDKISLDLQRAALQAWERRYPNRRIVEWVEDPDVTGRNFKRKIMGCIRGVEERGRRGIVVWKFSRFGRNDVGIAVNLARVERAGGDLASATEDIDARTAVGKFNRRILFDLAVFESDRAGEQWKETHQWRRAHGLPATGGKRMGYVWYPRRIPHPTMRGEWTLQDERYEVDEPGREDIEALYERKLGKELPTPAGYGQLAAWLNDLGYRTADGNPWRYDSLRRYMQSGFAAGLLRVHDPRCRCDYTANGGNCTRWIHIDGAQEAIITPETWERYEELSKERAALTPRARNPTYPLTGLVRCGACRKGAGCTSAKRKGVRLLGYAYACGESRHKLCDSPVWVQRALVEDEVHMWLAREVAAVVDAAPASPVALDDDQERKQARAARDRARLEAEHTRLVSGLSNLAADRALTPDAYPDGVFEQARDRLLAQKRNVAEALEAAAVAEVAPDRSKLIPIAVGLLEEWDTLVAAEKNAILRSLIRRVVATRGAKGVRGLENSGKTKVTIHPLWDPDPWDDTPA
ncbi:recombinase family protein [Streptomyces sp. NBC_00984]|uniref:recombinase family protein n=1 Tax=Streptomyces sp. NBC_00984 TaxID=2903700 RepID=UPI00386E6296|nr:recombinase family protein [Streptomyces sp. NBC_00984]